MIDWFRHDYKARTHPTMQRIQMKWGWEGVGIYWAIIELLYECDGHLSLDEIDSYAFALRLDSDWLSKFIQECKAFVIEDGKVVSSTVIDRLNERAELSEKRSNASKKRWSYANALQTESKSNAKTIKDNTIQDNTTKKESGYSPDFESAWELYQRKGAKKEAYKSWKSLTKDERELAVNAIPAYLKSKPDVQYRKDFERYLKSGAFEAELPPANASIGLPQKPVATSPTWKPKLDENGRRIYD